MRKRLYWGIAPLIILMIGVAAVLMFRGTETDPVTIYKVPPDEQVRRTFRKKPPVGETFMTGHWEGDVWVRTAPPAPETVTVGDEVLSYEELKEKARGGGPAAKALVREYPYSPAALRKRYNYIRGYSKAEKLEKYKEMLKYHPDSPRLLYDIMRIMYDNDSFEEAIRYGKEAVKYADAFVDTSYARQAYPEKIHCKLSYAYQKLGDYKSALVHLKSALEYVDAYPQGRSTYWFLPDRDLIVTHIEKIEAGRPVYGPQTPISGTPRPEPLKEAWIQMPGDSHGEDHAHGEDAATGPRSGMRYADTGEPVKRVPEADQWLGEPPPSWRGDVEMAREFDEFVRWLEEVERAASPKDLDNFLMREMAKQLQGGEPLFSADRMVRARELLQRHGEAEGMRRLEKRDAALAREMERQRPPSRSRPRNR